MNKSPKVIVIGLDGATWDLIKPWVGKDNSHFREVNKKVQGESDE